MYLKRIQVYGFKSFADDVRIDLVPGITAIVGPNGGGKSNIVDAIRWALGEQRVRDLRAERWEDLLHAGGAGRPAARLAEVRLEFDNQDLKMAHWPESLTVTRRYYRNGDTEYLINGRSVRLKDITDLFLDSGLGRFNYAIISQGRVETALLQKPADRLEQLEEAAGVSRYKMRKKETLSHLAEVEAKLVRLTDLRHEVERQAEELRDRAERESQYLAWEAERRAWQERLALTEYQHAQSQYQSLLMQLTALAQEKEALAREMAETQTAFESVQSELAAHESEASRIWQQVREGEEQAHRLAVELSQKEATLAGLKREQDGLHMALNRLRQQQQAENEEMTDEELNGLADALRVAEDEWQNWAARVEETEAAIRETERQLAAVAEERHRRETQIAHWRGTLGVTGDAELAAIYQERRQKAQRLEQEVQALTQNLAQLTEARTRLKAFIAKQQQDLESLRHQLAGRQARLRALHQLDAEGEGLAPGVRAVLKAQQTNQLTGIWGTLGGLIQADPELLLAISTALGGSHQDVVVDHEAEARQAVQWLKTHALGRATFLPLDAVRPARPHPDDRSLTRQPGVVGWAAELVRHPEAITPAVAHVLGRVLVVDNLDHAGMLGRLHKYRYKMVTLDGQIVHAGGAITGGSRAVDRSGPTHRKIEMEELARRIEEDRRVLEGKEALVASSLTELEATESELDRVREILGERRHEWTGLRQQLALGGSGIEEAMQQLAELTKTHALFSQTLDESRRTLETAIRERARTEKIRDERRRAWQEAQFRAEKRAADVARWQDEWSWHQERLYRLEGEIEQLASAIDSEKGRLRDTRQTVETAEAARRQLTAAMEALRERQLTLTNRLRVLEVQDRKLDQRQQQGEKDAQLIRVRYEHYEPPAGVKPLAPEEVDIARQEVQRVQRAIESLGPVEPGSLALYQALNDRLAFLAREQADVEAAEADLRTTLKELDQEMGRRVQATSQQVERAFQEACRQLYGGGEAGFHWTEGTDGGVELWVKPPGKRPSHLSLLSGGEKALGGIAWLFALLSVRPAPFVVLDEVEASLDAVNAARFAEFLKSVRGASQYLVVTHHKETMEAADVLWGVAGNGQGQSRVVSVKLESAPDESAVLPAGME